MGRAHAANSVKSAALFSLGRGGKEPLAWLLALPPVLAVILAFILPYGASFWNALASFDEISVLENSALLRVTLFTLKQAFASVLVSLAIGLPGAWFIGSGDSLKNSRAAPLLRTLTAVPFAMPSILTVLGFVLFFGNSGWINRLIAALGGSPLRILYKPEAVILAHGFLNFPLVIRLVGDGMDKIRGTYAPAAASLGASPLVTAFSVIFPLTLPAFLSAVLLVFLYSFTSFAVVLVLGGGPASTTLSVEIYRHAKVFLNYPNAGALALIETFIALSIFFAYVFFGKKSAGIKTDMQERVSEEKKSSGAVRIFAAAYAVFAVLFILGPIFSIVLESLLYRTSRSAARVLSFRWWQSLGETCLPAFSRSLILAFFSATLASILAVLGAGAVTLLEKSSGKKSAGSIAVTFIRFCAAAPVISSGIILGLGWLIMYGRNSTGFPLPLVMLHALIALPFAFNSVSEGFRSLPENILNAAMVSGASPLRAMLTTALPLSLPRLRSAWGFAAALSLGELNAAMMLGIEGWETLPLYIYRAAGAYRYGTACAAGTLLIFACAAGLFLSESGRNYFAEKKHGY